MLLVYFVIGAIPIGYLLGGKLSNYLHAPLDLVMLPSLAFLVEASFGKLVELEGLAPSEWLCWAVSIKHYLGTEMNLEKGTFERWCFRDKKIEFFREAYPDGIIDDFYTDSLHDEFLFPYAKRVFLVKGHKITQIK